MAEESDIFPIVKILEDINQADKTSASSKYINKEEVTELEPTSHLENISNALNLIIKRMGSIEKGLKEEKPSQTKEKTPETYDPSKKYSELSKKPLVSRQQPSTTEDKTKKKELSNTLSEVEKQRYKSIFEIFSKTVEVGKFAKDIKPNAPKPADKVTDIIPKLSIPAKIVDKVTTVASKYGFRALGETPYDFKALEKTINGQGVKILSYNPYEYDKNRNLKPNTVNQVVPTLQKVIPTAVVEKDKLIAPKTTLVTNNFNRTFTKVVEILKEGALKAIAPASTTKSAKDSNPKAITLPATNKVVEKVKDIAPKAIALPVTTKVVEKAKEVITKVITLPAPINRIIDKEKNTSSKDVNKSKSVSAKDVSITINNKVEVAKAKPATLPSAANKILGDIPTSKISPLKTIFTKVVELMPRATPVSPTIKRVEDKVKDIAPKASLIPTVNKVITYKPIEEATKQSKEAVSNTISETEKQKFKIIFEILGSTLGIGKYTKGPEATRLKLGATPGTKVAGKVLPVDIKSKRAADESSSLFDILKDNKALLASLALAYNLLNNNVSGTLQSLYRVVSQATGSLLNAVKDKFSKFKPIVDDVFSTLGKGISDGLTKLKDKFKPALDDIVSTLGKGISDGLTKLKDKFKPALDDIVSTLGKGISDGLIKLKDGVKGGISTGVNKVKQLASAGAAAVASGVSKVASSVTSALPSRASKVIDFIKSGAVEVTSKAGRAVQGVKGAIMTGAGKVAQLAKSGVAAASSVADRSSPSPATVLEKLKGWSSKIYANSGGSRGLLKKIATVLKPLARVPIVGTAIEVFFGKGQIEEYKKMRASNQIKTDDELYFLAGQRVIQGVAGILGGASGAAAANLLTGGLATLAGGLGTFAGGLIGDIVGRYGARVVTDYIIPKSETRELGKIVVDSPIREEELQDFLVKGNRVYRFNNKDEVLGMKAGGAVNNLISSITNTNDKQFSIATRQVKILEEIREGIKALILKETSNNNYNSTSGGRTKETRPSMSPFNLRSEFDSMNNIATI